MERPLFRLGLAALAALAAVAACSKSQVGADCALDRSCPDNLKCFADFRCYPKTADPGCSPPCYGTEPFCDKSTLRCVACLKDDDCGAGELCTPPVMRCERGCSATHPSCSDPNTRCDVDAGVCRGCQSDSDCTDPVFKRCTLSTGVCDACSPDGGDCPNGQYCDENQGRFTCIPGCLTAADCADAGVGMMDCCGSRCVDTSSSAAHCGGCGSPCFGNQSCCGGQCADLNSDVDNCSACGMSCSLPQVASPMCNNGQCFHAGCESYYGDCNGTLADGCETNLSYDPHNCSSCGHTCPSQPNLPGICNLGSCTYGACDAGWGNCDSMLGNGCETPLDTVQHCGSCTTSCTGAQICDAGQCF